MFLSMILPADHRVKLEIVDARENIVINVRIVLFKLSDQFTDLQAFGSAVISGYVFGKPAGALDEVEIVRVFPGDDIRFMNEIHGSDQFHAREMLCRQTRRHCLDLTAVKHGDERRADDIVKMMAEGNLIASKFLSFAV